MSNARGLKKTTKACCLPLSIRKYAIIVLLGLCSFSSFSFALTYDQVVAPEIKVKTYGGAQVSAIGKVQEAYSFRCDIKGWPAIIGEDICVRVAGLQFPDIVIEQGASNKFFQQQTMKFLADFLKNKKKVHLTNIRRGKDFCLVADVIADANSLAEVLIKKGLAQKAKKIDARETAKTIAAFQTQTNATSNKQSQAVVNITWVASSNSKIFHKSTCSTAKRLKKSTAIKFPTRQKAIETGRRPCKNCKP